MTPINNNQMSERGITRCGMCGIWLLNGKVLQPTYFTSMRIAELEKSGKYELDYCSDCANELNNPQRRVTKDMAIDAGDLSLEGQLI